MPFAQSQLVAAPLDLLVVGLFVLGLVALGFSAKLRDNSVLQYLAAGRNLSLPAFVATLVSTWYGGILAIGESVAAFGLGTWVLMGLPYYVFGVGYALWLAPRVRKGDQISIPERFETRFGRGPALVAAILLFLLAVPAAHVLMLGIVVSSVAGVSLLPAVLVAVLVGTLFLWKGGILADVRVAMLAFLMMYVGFAVISVYSLTTNPPAQAFASIRSTPLWTWDGGQGPLFVLSFFILGAWTLVDPGFHQRVASAASPEIGRKGILIGVGFWMLFDLLSITAGLYAVVTLPDLLASESPLDRLAAFPRLGSEVLPPGLRAIFFCGMIGTIVSALVGYGLIAGATVGREVFARVRRETSDAEVQRWTKIGIVIAFAVASIVGLQVQSVVALWYSWAGAVVGAMLIPLLASYAPSGLKSVSPAAIAWTTSIAALASLGWMAYGIRTGNPYLSVQIGEETLSVGTLLPGLAISAIGLGGAHFLAIIRKRP